MKIEIIQLADIKVAEVISDTVLIHTPQNALDMMADLYYQEFDAMILHEQCITPAFFDLKTGIAGEILQKFSNYNMRLAIIGDFSKYRSQSLHAFIMESNKRRHVSFVSSLEEAKGNLIGK